MRVLLLVSNADTMAGSGRNTANMKKAIEAAGHTVVVLAREGSLLRTVLRAWHLAARSDIVQSVDMSPMGFVGYLATRFSRAKFIIVAQAAYAVAPLYNRKTKFISRIAYRAADAVVAGSAFVAQEIEKCVPVRVIVIDPGIDLATFPGIHTDRAPEVTPFLLGVGAVKARKGYDVSLRAFALAKQKFPALRYVIVGSQSDEPNYFRSLVELAQSLNVREDVDFLTRVPDKELERLYSRAAIFILTSVNMGMHFEGFGMVFLEAAAYGLPSIGTLGNGIEGAVEQGKTGILVPQRDPQAAAQAIQAILSNRNLAERMSLRAREFVHEHDIAHLTELYSALFQRVLSR